MAVTSLQRFDLSPEPDLHPLYPTTTYLTSLLSPHSGLSSTQRAKLVSHSLSRACVFGELSLLQYLLSDPQTRPHVDLRTRDEDGLGLVTLVIHGLGADSDRDVEREECVRLLIAQGADLGADKGDVKVSYICVQFISDACFKLVGHRCIMLLSCLRRHWSPT